MPIARYYAPDGAYAICVYTGIIDRATIRDHLVDHVADPLHRATMPEISDLRNIEDLQLDFGSMRGVVREKNDAYRVQKTISVFAPGDVAFGVARIYQSLAEADGGIQVSVFRTEAETLAFHDFAAESIAELLKGCVAREVREQPTAATLDPEASVDDDLLPKRRLSGSVIP
ncbi:hypothetical protein [Sagittula salina]|uniref:Uncharacterized protein n=1 Tax=Sagittula salina TaxID=2820268 RepID=A0A940RZ94_9RHOB|nr:hypothetical protein [Sagittula salina]MBP0481743.1 hypothetical protein [Sagittula salina]